MQDRGLEVDEFDLQSRYYVHFWTNILGKCSEIHYLPTYGEMVSLWFIYKVGLGIK